MNHLLRDAGVSMTTGLRAKRVSKEGTVTVVSLEEALRHIAKFGDPPLSRARAAAMLVYGKRVRTKTAYFLMHYGD